MIIDTQYFPHWFNPFHESLRILITKKMSAVDPLAANALSAAILKTVAYADVFDYPLTSAEIWRYLIEVRASLHEVERALAHIPRLTKTRGHYTLSGREGLVSVRLEREGIAARLWPAAIHYGRHIARLPFVRMVAVTGALAMNNIEQAADIDYLIVTDPGRLWSCRALVMLVRRWASLRGVVLCPNYLISLRNLVFPDRTLYAAHEIAQMVPLAGLQVYESIRRRNSWVSRFLPNAQGLPPAGLLPAQNIQPELLRPSWEAILRAAPFIHFELWEMKRKIQRLRLEQAASPESAFSANYCKGHADLHQARTQLALDERLTALWQEELP